MNVPLIVTDKNDKSMRPHHDGISVKMVRGAINKVEAGAVAWYLTDIPDSWVDAAAVGSGDAKEELKSALGKDVMERSCYGLWEKRPLSCWP